MTVVGNWSIKGQETIMKEFVTKTNEPWITQDSLSTYGDMWIFKDALEKAGAADRKKVAEAIRAMDTREGPAKYFPGGRSSSTRTAGASTPISPSCSGRTARRSQSIRSARRWPSRSGRSSRQSPTSPPGNRSRYGLGFGRAGESRWRCRALALLWMWNIMCETDGVSAPEIMCASRARDHACSTRISWRGLAKERLLGRLPH